MKTILSIIQKAGGWRPGLYLKIENAPYMELVIEAMDESGPCGLPGLSIAHYGNALCQPEMCFELGFAGGAHLNPFYYRDESLGVEQWSRNIIGDHYMFMAELYDQHQRFAKTWDNKLRLQRYAEVFTAKCILG